MSIKIPLTLILGLIFINFGCVSKPKYIDSPLFKNPLAPDEDLSKIPREAVREQIKVEELQQNTARPKAVKQMAQVVYIAPRKEYLSFVAQLLTGDQKNLALLRSLNNIKPGEKFIEAGKEVRIDLNLFKPQFKMLPKNFLVDNAALLQTYVKEDLKDYTVVADDTLQSIALKLYASSRAWTLLYVLNQKQLKSFDKLKVGQVLQVAADLKLAH